MSSGVLHKAGLTKGFEHSCLLFVSRFCPINDISKLCKHLYLKTGHPQSYICHTFSAKRENNACHIIDVRQTDPREDDITRLCHRPLPAVNIHHCLLHQNIIQLPPVWPARSHSCSSTGGFLSGHFAVLNRTHFSSSVTFSHLPRGLLV